MILSFWTSGLYYNFLGLKSSHAENLRVTGSSYLPIYIAGFRTLKLISLASYGYFFFTLSSDDKSRDWMMRVIIITAALVAVAQIITQLGLMDLSLSYGDTGGVYVGPRILGQTKATIGRFFFMGVLLCLARYERGNKLELAGLTIILTAGLALSGSRAGILALLASFFPIYLLGRSRGIAIGVVTMVFVVLVGFWALNFSEKKKNMLVRTFEPKTVETASTRLPIWKETVSAWFDNPMILLFGVGVFNFSYAGLPVHFEHAHNDMLSISTELGLFGTLVFSIALCTIFVTLFSMAWCNDSKKKWFYLCVFSMFVGLLVASMFEPTFYPTISTLPLLRVIIPLIFFICRVENTDIKIQEVPYGVVT